MRLSYEFIRDSLPGHDERTRKILKESYYPFDYCIDDGMVCFWKRYGKRSGEVSIIFDHTTKELERIEADVKHVDEKGRSQAFMDVANFVYKMAKREYIE